MTTFNVEVTEAIGLSAHVAIAVEPPPPRHYVLHAEAGTFKLQGHAPLVHLSRPTPATPRISLSGIARFCDLMPTPRVRKRLRKMLGDQGAHITDLQAAGRHRAARWIQLCTTGWVLWQIAISPFLAVACLVVRLLRQS
jgi:hypothetical protein